MQTYPKLSAGEVHVWSAVLDKNPNEVAPYVGLLSEDERERADRFKFAQHRDRFVIARGILRQLLGHYLSCAPSQIKFAYTDKGKPYVDSPSKLIDIHFNLSHSQNRALYGFAKGQDIGVDIEQISEKTSHEEIAKRYFSEREYEALLQLSDFERVRGFFRCWARKEAFIKAVGEGLSFPLDQIDVGVKECQGEVPLHVLHKGFAALDWRLYDLKTSRSFAAAFAVYGNVDKVLTFDW